VQVDVAQLTDHDVDHDMAQLDRHFSQEPSLAALANAPTPVIDSTTAAPAGPAIPHLTLCNAARGRVWRAEQARRREAKFEVRGMVTEAETTKAVSSLRSPELADRDERARVEAWLEAERDRVETETTQIMAEAEQATSASELQSVGQTRSVSPLKRALDQVEADTAQIMAEAEQDTSTHEIQSGGQTQSLSYLRRALSAGRHALGRARAANDLRI
jgi:hypothetical protein